MGTKIAAGRRDTKPSNRIARTRKELTTCSLVVKHELRIDCGRILVAASTCSAEVEAIRAVWTGRIHGYAKAAMPVTSAQV